MIVGIGTDICEVSRIKRALDRQVKFAQRILTSSEQALCFQKKEPFRYLASRFAAKEAVLKALGTGLAKGISWHDIEVSNLESGQPVVELTGGALNVAEQRSVSSIHLSISDEKEYVVGFVVLESS